jgi:hypothetical protein
MLKEAPLIKTVEEYNRLQGHHIAATRASSAVLELRIVLRRAPTS